MRVKLKDFLVYCLNISVLIVFVYLMMISWDKVFLERWSVLPTICTFIMFFANLWLMFVYKVQLYDFRLFYMLLSYVFMFGRVWLNAFELDGNIYWVLHKYFEGIDMQRAAMFCVCAVQTLALGVFWPNSCSQKDVVVSIRSDAGSENVYLYNTAIILLAIGLPCRLFSDLYTIMTTFVLGSYNSIASPVGIVDDLAYLFVPGILALIESRPKFKTRVMVVTMIYFIIIMILSGDRRFYVTVIIALGCYYLKFLKEKKKLKVGRLVLLGFLAALFLNLMEIIMQIRQEKLVSLSEFMVKHGASLFKLDDLVYDVLMEFGISFFSVVLIIQYIPSLFPIQYGASFIKAIPSILPIGALFGDFFVSAVPSEPICESAGLPVGSTIIGDFYANFTLYGLIGLFFFGLLLKKIFNEKRLNDSFSKVLYYTHFFILINLVRSSFFEIFRPFVWCTVIPIVVYKIFQKRKGKRG